ncbi:MAG: hypothetical protein AAFY88_24795, partial [Acidobacteriota bacterium]
TANTTEDQVRTLIYDPSDRLSEKFDATGARATFQYDPAGNLVHEVDPKPNSILRAYDSRNRLTCRTEVTAAGDITTAYRYYANGNLIGETWPNGNELTHTYDRLNRLTKSVDSLGALSEYDYDARSNRIRQQDARGHDTFMTFDALDRLRQVQAPEGRTINLAYDTAGNLQTAPTPKIARPGSSTTPSTGSCKLRIRRRLATPATSSTTTSATSSSAPISAASRRASTTTTSIDSSRSSPRRSTERSPKSPGAMVRWQSSGRRRISERCLRPDGNLEGPRS